MNKMAVLCLVVLIGLSATAFAQDLAAVTKALADLQAALAKGDIALARTFISPMMLTQVEAAAPAPAVGQEEGEDFLHLAAAAFLKGELAGGSHQSWTVAGLSVQESHAISGLKLGDGRLVQLDWEQDPSGAWKIVPASVDIFRQEQKQDDANFQTLRQGEKKMEERQKEDQEIADDVNEDRRR